MITLEEYLAEVAKGAIEYYGRNDKNGMMTFVSHRLQEHPESERLAHQGTMLYGVLESGWRAGEEGLRRSICGLAVLVR